MCTLHLTAQADALVSSQITLSLLVALGSLQLFQTAPFLFLLQIVLSVAVANPTHTPPPILLRSCLALFLCLSSHLLCCTSTAHINPTHAYRFDSDKKNPYKAFGETLFSGLSPGPRILDIAFQPRKKKTTSPHFACY